MLVEETKARHCRPPLEKRHTSAAAITIFAISNATRPLRRRMSSEKRRNLAPRCKTRLQRSCERGPCAPLLHCTQPLLALVRGAQAGANLQCVAEIGNRARSVAEPHLGLAGLPERVHVPKGRVNYQGIAAWPTSATTRLKTASNSASTALWRLRIIASRPRRSSSP